MKTIPVASIFKKVTDLIEEDRNHRIVVKSDYIAGNFSDEVFGKKVPDYCCDSFAIFGGELWIYAGDWGIDGASYAPDKIGPLDLACAYIPHDLGYMEIEKMAADEDWIAAGWTVTDIRRLWDMVLGQAIRKEAERRNGFWRPVGNAIARIYYSVVRMFGGWFHRSSLVLIVLALSGCGTSCAVPDGFTPSDEEPVYEVFPAQGKD